MVFDEVVGEMVVVGGFWIVCVYLWVLSCFLLGYG